MRALAARLLAAITAGAALAAGAAHAQVDPGAPEGAVQTVQTARDFDSYELPVGPFGIDRVATRSVEGAVEWRAHRLDDSGATVAGVMRAFRERLRGMGFEPVFECEGRACGGFDFRFGAEILPPPGMSVDVRDFAHLTARRESAAVGEEFVTVLVSRVLDAIHVQTVSVAPAAAPGAAEEDAPEREAAPENSILPEREQALLATLKRDGHVPVKGLDFEPGGAQLSNGSAGALDMLAGMLERDGELRVAIVGHSDNQGKLDLNLELSRQRAEAVMQALVERGVPPGRMEAHGLGYLAPVASNASEEGRAANRRVELVLR